MIDRLSQSLHPNTNVYCDQFFTSIQGVEHMMEKQMHVTGTLVKKQPTDKTTTNDGSGTSAQVTTEDGKLCGMTLNRY